MIASQVGRTFASHSPLAEDTPRSGDQDQHEAMGACPDWRQTEELSSFDHAARLGHCRHRTELPEVYIVNRTALVSEDHPDVDTADWAIGQQNISIDDPNPPCQANRTAVALDRPATVGTERNIPVPSSDLYDPKMGRSVPRSAAIPLTVSTGMGS
ncbi:hypothetical protein [Pseudonocardia xishanensis]|uniref:Uncharacterized protein n=1 Tax=Pseudonocardia xishanensis TaxID=630995 RepID=A0ABP8RW89_9PSEU